MHKYYQINSSRILLSALALILSSTLTYASNSVGTIDSMNKITRVCQDSSCNNYGQVNFAPTIVAGVNPVTITDTSITGHAWGDQIGWINMNPTGLGPSDMLKVDPSTGVITGKAYANTGSWINFSPTGAGVSLVDNGSGSNFYGYAWVSGNYGGWMKFDCASASTCVKTDWRTISNRSTSTPVSPVVSGGAGGLLPFSSSSTSTPSTLNQPIGGVTSTPAEINNNLPTDEQYEMNNTGVNPNNTQASSNTSPVKKLLPLTADTAPRFPSLLATSSTYRQVFPILDSGYGNYKCIFCLLLVKKSLTGVDNKANFIDRGLSITLKYGFVHESITFGLYMYSEDGIEYKIDLTSILITLIVLYFIIKMLIEKNNITDKRKIVKKHQN